jgi:hypothetical protein
MRQQAGFGQHRVGGTREVLQRRRAAELGELCSRDAVAQLGFVAEREEGLATAGGGPCARNRENFVDRQVRALAAPGRPRERAVVADVATKLRQRNEDLRRVRDQPPMALVAERPSLGAQILQRPVEQLHRSELTPPLVSYGRVRA